MIERNQIVGPERDRAIEDSKESLEYLEALDFGPNKVYVDPYLTNFATLMQSFDYKGLEKENSHIFGHLELEIGSQQKLTIDQFRGGEFPNAELKTLVPYSFGISLYTDVMIGKTDRPFLFIAQAVIPTPVGFDEIDLENAYESFQIIIRDTPDAYFMKKGGLEKHIPVESALGKLKKAN